MSAVLLDVNVLIALLWPSHEAHALCRRWFEKQAHRSWATCALTQAGFVRIVSNPAFSPDAPPARQVIEHLARNLAHPGHQFWPLDLSLEEAVRPFASRLYGHRQVTDAYLLGLAVHREGRLATLDAGIAALAPPPSGLQRHVIRLG
jgi:toxin-antitoxin system PIN domain toxin